MKDPFKAIRRQMVEDQLIPRGINDSRVINAMQTVPRHKFVGLSMQNRAYVDSALPLEAGQTISQPYIVALMTQSLELTGTEKVLEIGTGSGYQAAVLSMLAGHVFTLERIPDLAKKARIRLEELGYDNVVVSAGDGTIGWNKFAPFDRIMITAAAPNMPVNLISQLSDGGILISPVGGKNRQELQVLRRRGEKYRIERSIGCIFVPLIGIHGWEKS